MDVLRLCNEITSSPLAEQNERLKKELAHYLNELLLHDFAALVQLLYQVDVPEKKLKAVLQDNPSNDAGSLIADLLIERQREKIAAKKSFQYPKSESGEERW